MAVSRLRQWWGSRRLLRIAAGLTLVAVAAGPGTGIAAGSAAPLRDAIATATSAPAPHATRGAPLTGNGVARRSVEPAGTVASVHDQVDVAPFGVLSTHLAAGASPQRTAAPHDTVPLVGVARAPRGPRAPPLDLV